MTLSYLRKAIKHAEQTTVREAAEKYGYSPAYLYQSMHKKRNKASTAINEANILNVMKILSLMFEGSIKFAEIHTVLNVPEWIVVYTRKLAIEYSIPIPQWYHPKNMNNFGKRSK